MKQRSRWSYVAAGVVVLLFAGLVYAWSVMSVPIAAEFPQWTKAQLSLAFTIVMIVFCLGQLLCGVLAGKMSARVNVWVAAVCFLAGFYLASRAQSPLALYLAFGVLCGLGSGLAYNAVVSTVVRWFPDKPGFISGVLLMGFGIGSFIVGKLYQAWTPAYVGGWRLSFVVMGIVICVVLAFCAFFFQVPGKDFKAPAGQKKTVVCREDCRPAVMLRRPAFWLYYVWAIALSAAGLALISQASSIVREIGPSVAPGAVATIVGLISIFNAIGRVLFGGMYDKRGRSLSMQLVNVLFLITAAILLFALKNGSVAVLVAGFIVAGLGYGGVTPTNSAFIRSYFGPANYPINFPLVNSNLIIASFGSTVAGALFDKSGSYSATFLLIVALAAVGICCSLGISLADKRSKQ